MLLPRRRIKSPLTVLKPHLESSTSFGCDQTGEAGMIAMAARQDRDMILAKEPCRSAIRAAPAPRHVPLTYAELAAVLAEMRKLQNIRYGDGVLIVGEDGAPLLAIAEIDAWRLAVKPRLTAAEVERLGKLGAACRTFLHQVPDTGRRHADTFVVRGPRMRDAGPLLSQDSAGADRGGSTAIRRGGIGH
jgi:hypothetical protein